MLSARYGLLLNRELRGVTVKVPSRWPSVNLCDTFVRGQKRYLTNVRLVDACKPP